VENNSDEMLPRKHKHLNYGQVSGMKHSSNWLNWYDRAK